MVVVDDLAERAHQCVDAGCVLLGDLVEKAQHRKTVGIAQRLADGFVLFVPMYDVHLKRIPSERSHKDKCIINPPGLQCLVLLVKAMVQERLFAHKVRTNTRAHLPDIVEYVLCATVVFVAPVKVQPFQLVLVLQLAAKDVRMLADRWVRFRNREGHCGTEKGTERETRKAKGAVSERTCAPSAQPANLPEWPLLWMVIGPGRRLLYPTSSIAGMYSGTARWLWIAIGD